MRWHTIRFTQKWETQQIKCLNWKSHITWYISTALFSYSHFTYIDFICFQLVFNFKLTGKQINKCIYVYMKPKQNIFRRVFWEKSEKKTNIKTTVVCLIWHVILCVCSIECFTFALFPQLIDGLFEDKCFACH